MIFQKSVWHRGIDDYDEYDDDNDAGDGHGVDDNDDDDDDDDVVLQKLFLRRVSGT